MKPAGLANQWLRWTPGRQGTGYGKMLRAISPFPVAFDLYLLRYKAGQGIPTHTDPVPGKRHYRLNIEIIRSGLGGHFICATPHFRRWRMIFFRPDLQPHSVSPVEFGKRYILSLGWVLKNNPSQATQGYKHG